MRRRRRASQAVDLGGERAGVLAVAGLAAGDERADAQRVEDGGDAGAGELGVVGEDRRSLGPVRRRGAARGGARGCRCAARRGPARGSRRRSPRRRAARAAPVSIGGDAAVAHDEAAGRGSRSRAARRALASTSSRGCGDAACRVALAGLSRCARGPTMGDWRRHAIYFAPPARQRAGAASARAGSAGTRSAGEAVAGLAVPGLPLPRAALTAAPRRYGFHATLKPPFRLAAGAERRRARRGGSRRWRPGSRRSRCGCGWRRSGGFLALVPEAAPPALAALAEACVTGLDAFRAPPAAAELARRRVGRARRGRGGQPAPLGLSVGARPLPLPHDADRAAGRPGCGAGARGAGAGAGAAPRRAAAGHGDSATSPRPRTGGSGWPGGFRSGDGVSAVP